jgi:ABC-type dipeptide/oligopeptide/nickel transport system permease component
MEVLLALVVFAVMIICWLMLPSAPSQPAQRYETEAAGPEALQQLA